MFIFRFLKDNIHFGALAIVILAGKVNSKFCNGGHFCSPPKECCTHGCCYVFSPGYRSPVPQGNATTLFNLVVWNHWFLWCLLLLLCLSCLGGCGLWRRRQFSTSRWCCRSHRNDEERSEPDSIGSCYPPPHYSRCSFHQAPPPYSEVTSKPDLYPLVISYASENGKIGDNYLMVQYFRNYIVRPTLGSLSAESTVDSISSSFLCQSANDTDSNIPPPYENPRAEADREDSRLGRSVSPGISQSNRVFPQVQIQNGVNHSDGGTILSAIPDKDDLRSVDLEQVMARTIHHSIQKASVTGSAKFKSMLPPPFYEFRTLPGPVQCCSSNPYAEPTGNRNVCDTPLHSRLTTFKESSRSAALSSTSLDPIHERNAYAVHQYPPDVILAQPQSYCEPSNELHYHSADVVSNPNRSSKYISDSFSSEDNLSQPRGSLQDFVSSDGLSHSQPSNLETNNYSTGSDVSSLQGCGTPDSPPKATSPTCEFRDLIDKIQRLPGHRDCDRSPASPFRGYVGEPFPKKFRCVKNSDPRTGDAAGGDEEDSLLLNDPERETVEVTEPRDSVPVRPNKLLFKKSFPSKSKTFYLSFGSNSMGRKRTGSVSNSFSAPVTPVASFPSPGSVAVNFLLNTKKPTSRKSVEQVTDFSPLLQEEDSGNNDEIF